MRYAHKSMGSLGAQLHLHLVPVNIYVYGLSFVNLVWSEEKQAKKENSRNELIRQGIKKQKKIKR